MPASGLARASRRTLLGLPLLALGAATAAAQAARFFRIGTGSVSGTYYPVGGLVAEIISSPPGSPSCDGGVCGVPGLVAVVQTSDGSVANIDGIEKGDLESGFAQSDVAFGAFSGTGVFRDRPPATRIRAIASLYAESVQLVARADAGIGTVADLAGKRVSLDRAGSGTRVDAELILAAFGLSPSDLEAEDDSPADAVDRMSAGELDAFFVVAGVPTAGVAELADGTGIVLVPIAGPEAGTLVADHPFFARDVIPAGTYAGVGPVDTLSVRAQWLVSADLEADLVHAILAAFWNPAARTILDAGHPKGRQIVLGSALDGIAIPLHPGAERFYREAGMMP
ncbi:MAG: TAXI family TRAP transporter solute-binding subunit [Geminicoccaceae bacterium]